MVENAARVHRFSCQTVHRLQVAIFASNRMGAVRSTLFTWPVQGEHLTGRDLMPMEVRPSGQYWCRSSPRQVQKHWARAFIWATQRTGLARSLLRYAGLHSSPSLHGQCSRQRKLMTCPEHLLRGSCGQNIIYIAQGLQDTYFLVTPKRRKLLIGHEYRLHGPRFPNSRYLMQHLTSVWTDYYAKSIATQIGNSIQVGISHWMVEYVGSILQDASRIARASRTSWAACTSLRRWMDEP